MKDDVNVPTVSTGFKQKKTPFVCVLEATEVGREYDLRIRIRIKTSRIRNTDRLSSFWTMSFDPWVDKV